jgi:hypothetical protein
MNTLPIAVNDLQTYSKAGNLKTKGCNSILFFNQGDVTILINNVLRIVPGNSFSINQVMPNVLDETAYMVSFLLTDSATTGTNQQLVTICTFVTFPSQKLNPNGPNNCN